MKLLNVIKTFFSHGTYGYELLFHIYKTPTHFRNENFIQHELHSHEEVPDAYLDYSCQQVMIDGQNGQINFYLSENDEDF